MTILYISDFDLKGSGYSNIALKLCTHLVNHGYDVLTVGFGYKGEEHNHPFTIIPLHGLEHIAPMIKNLQNSGVEIEAIVTALDIPLQLNLLRHINAPGDIPYIGIFPLEAGPLCQSWAIDLLRMDKRLIMTEFGKEELARAGVTSTVIPIGVDTESWRPPTPDERTTLRKALGVKDDTFVVLTVADNQERKNLSRSMEIFADFSKDYPNSQYWLVTRVGSPVGWKLNDLAIQLGIMDKFNAWDRGMAFKQLWGLFAASDCFLLTSKAEGLAMPVLEAMAMRLPVVGTDCTAIREHLFNRGYLINTDYVIIDPFGNGNRYFADRTYGAHLLKDIPDPFYREEKELFINEAYSYVQARTWDKAGAVLVEAIEHAKLMRKPASMILPEMAVLNG